MMEQLERPRVVSAKLIPLETKDNYFAQVVVRLHSAQVMKTCIVTLCCQLFHISSTPRVCTSSPTIQVLAVYNAAGKLIRGHPSNPKRVIDYIVMERHLAKPGSGWRVAGKLPPQVPWKTLQQSQKDEDKDRPRSLPAT